MRTIEPLLEPGDALIIIPPFSCLDKPSMGPHILKACALSNNFDVKILYANFIYAEAIGTQIYQYIAYNSNPTFIGEKIFAPYAYNLESFMSDEFETNYRIDETFGKIVLDNGIPDLKLLEKMASLWVDTICEAVVKMNYKVVACTSTFEQTASSISLLKKIKSTNREIITAMGGANCHGSMGKGILSLSESIDYVFTGESETAFPEFLKQITCGKKPETKLIHGNVCMDLDSIPTVDYSEFYNQFKKSTIEKDINFENIWMPYETSRGCWWGEKIQCTFCGINGETIKYRMKSSERVLSELRLLLNSHPNKKVTMTDCNMANSYFETLLPDITNKFPDLMLFYELKSNLTLEQVGKLKDAGIAAIQPGIESLSTKCLQLMKKGVSAKQNIALMRYARIYDISVAWNMLYGIPGDNIEEYKKMYSYLPLLRHLQPPLGLSYICIERFSPYFTNPEEYGLKNIEPIDFYKQIFPAGFDISSAAYHFSADYESESRKDHLFMEEFKEEIKRWQDCWTLGKIPPVLSLTELDDDQYLLIDSRNLPGTNEINFLSKQQALLVTTGLHNSCTEDLEWALDRKLIIREDETYIPLCISDAKLMENYAVIS